MSIPSDLLSRALDLPAADRARLADELILSLDEEGPGRDPDWEAAWADESRRRMEAIDEGRTALIPRDVVHDELRVSLSRIRESRRTGRALESARPIESEQ
jgi:putative addiction module component (TIGR02574 family)